MLDLLIMFLIGYLIGAFFDYIKVGLLVVLLVLTTPFRIWKTYNTVRRFDKLLQNGHVPDYMGIPNGKTVFIIDRKSGYSPNSHRFYNMEIVQKLSQSNVMEVQKQYQEQINSALDALAVSYSLTREQLSELAIEYIKTYKEIEKIKAKAQLDFQRALK